MTTVINLFGGAGCGKSTGASFIFSQLKMLHVKCELIVEYAKELTYTHPPLLENQIDIFAEQDKRQRRLLGKVDYIVTDSPLFLGIVYAIPTFYKTFEPFCLEVFKSYNNINFYLQRSKPYQTYGRNQTLEEAIEIDTKIFNLLKKHSIDFQMIEGTKVGYNKVLSVITQQTG